MAGVPKPQFVADADLKEITLDEPLALCPDPVFLSNADVTIIESVVERAAKGVADSDALGFSKKERSEIRKTIKARLSADKSKLASALCTKLIREWERLLRLKRALDHIKSCQEAHRAETVKPNRAQLRHDVVPTAPGGGER